MYVPEIAFGNIKNTFMKTLEVTNSKPFLKFQSVYTDGNV
jgi:hypothetical protein